MGNILKYQNSNHPLIKRVNQSNANFVKRLLDPSRKHIQDWVAPLNVATHKLGWATEDTKQGAFVYPEIQEINGELVDFTNPKYRRSKGMNSAIERRDTVRMTPEQAEWFTENYKNYYPGFKHGGGIHIKPENKGKFTDYCGGKVTQECIQRGKRSSNPITRKRATFAANVRTWKHQEGGVITSQNNAIIPINSDGVLDRFNKTKLGKALDYIDLGADLVSMSGIPIASQVAGAIGMITGIPQAGIAIIDYAQKAKNGNYKPTLDQAIALSKLIPTSNLWTKAGTKALLTKSGPKLLRGPKPYRIISKWIPNGINLASDIYEITDH